MHRCLICGFKAKSGAGLAAHRRKAHPEFKGANRRAAEELIAEAKRIGRIDDIDVARVQMVRAIADQLDTDPSNAQMWRTYREVVDVLLAEDDGSGDIIEALLAEINGRAPVGNTAKT